MTPLPDRRSFLASSLALSGGALGVAEPPQGTTAATEGNPMSFGADGTGARASNDALRRADAVGEMILPPNRVFRVSADMTLSGNLRFAKGARIKPDARTTVRIAGGIQAGLHQIFDLSAGGSVVLADHNDVEMNPVWFGARADYAGDSTLAFQKCFASRAQRIFIPGGQYDVRDTITATLGGRAVVRGNGMNSAIYFNPQAANKALFAAVDTDNLILRDFAVNNTKRALERISAFDFNARGISQLVFEGIYIQNFTEFGVRLREAEHAYFRRCRIMDSNAPSGAPAHALYFDGYANHVEVDNCRFHRNDKIARVISPIAFVFRNCSSEADGETSTVPLNHMIEVSDGSTFSWVGGYIEAPHVGDGYAFIGFTGPMRSCAIRDTFFEGSYGGRTHAARFFDAGDASTGVSIEGCMLREVRDKFLVNSGRAPLRVRGCTFRQRDTEAATHNDAMALMSGAIELDNLSQTAPFNPGVITPGAGVTSAAVPLAGAALGDAVLVSFDHDLEGAQLTAYVEGPGMVRARVQRSIQAGALPARIPAGTLRFRLLKKD